MLTGAPLINQEPAGASPERGKSSFNLGNEAPRFDNPLAQLAPDATIFSDARPWAAGGGWGGGFCQATARRGSVRASFLPVCLSAPPPPCDG